MFILLVYHFSAKNFKGHFVVKKAQKSRFDRNFCLIPLLSAWAFCAYYIIQVLLLQEDVLQNKQYCQYPHKRGDLLCLACSCMKNYIGDNAKCDTF